MSLSRYFCTLPLLLFALNSNAERGATADDVHERSVAQLDHMNKTAIIVNCYYVPPASQYESGPSEDSSSELHFSKMPTQDCSSYSYYRGLYNNCLARNARINAKEIAERTEKDAERTKKYNAWINSYGRIITKTIPVWSKCPESVEVGYNKYTGNWRILE